MLTKTEVFEKLELIRQDGATPAGVVTRVEEIQAGTVEGILDEIQGPELAAAEAYLDTADRSTLTVDGLNNAIFAAFVSWAKLFGDTAS